MLDPDNPIVKLCAAGMRAEAERCADDARALFLQAWDARTDDYEACIAAHFVARHADRPQEALHWNQVALAHADGVDSERVQDFYPSLYLNLGFAHEVLGQHAEAARHYAQAAAAAVALPASPYTDMVREGIRNALQRMTEASGQARQTCQAPLTPP
jgi:tetratricopeptide (TPR) repeat protein